MTQPSLLDLRLRWEELAASARKTDLRVAILSTFTVNPVAPYLGCALEDAKLPVSIFIGPYNQLMSECMNPSSETAAFAPQALIFWPRLEDLWNKTPGSAPLDDFVEAPRLQIEA